jgi:diguanylate cyclase (GGDEF)-like protein
MRLALSPSGALDAWRKALTVLDRARPKGRSLPEDTWNRRHRGIIVLLLFQAIGLAFLGVQRGHAVTESILEGCLMAIPGLVALSPSASRTVRAGAATIGLVLESAVLVHLSGGLVEMHFHFFVMIGVISLYQDWSPFLLALAFVVLHHGTAGVYAPEAVYNHASAWHHPWRWAAIHGGFILTASITSLINWRVSEQAFHDPLTGLANRPLFIDRTMHALGRAERHRADDQDRQVAVLFLDLDHFKTVNDSLGHRAGDQLVFTVAQRLRACLRGETASAARLGGDEFAICLEGATLGEAAALANRILVELRRPLVVNDKELFIDGSIGIAMSDGSGDGAEELLRNADTAMYEAKREGRGRYATFDASMLRDVIDHLDLHADLQRAIIRHELLLYYQPIVALDTGAITGVEALLRWRHPTRGMVQPATFIPLAEETGLIVPIGRWVLGEACRQAVRWHEANPGRPPLTVTVNVSGRQLQQPDFVSHVAEALEASGLRPGALVLEITESVLMLDTTSVIERLQQLKDLGTRIAIDDFGTGYSSLSYLQRFPVDILKIDRSFVSPDDAGNSETLALVRAIVQLSQELRLRTVAEGVEDADQLTQMRRLGCDSGQGFLFARPLDADAMSSLLANGESLVPAPTHEITTPAR